MSDPLPFAYVIPSSRPLPSTVSLPSTASAVLWADPTSDGVAARGFGFPSPRAPAGDQPTDTIGPPRFRHDPFLRDVISDPGRALVSRMAMPDMLPSTILKASASAMSSFRGSMAHPTGLLCTLQTPRRRDARNTHYQAARYGPTWAGLPPAGSRQLTLAHQELTPVAVAPGGAGSNPWWLTTWARPSKHLAVSGRWRFSTASNQI